MENEGLLILCGPIVRRVDRSSVSVFVVTRRPREVVLRVHTNKGIRIGDLIMEGKRRTIALGNGLHAVVVTARKRDALDWGTSYQYDLAFVGDGATQKLYDDGVLVKDVGDTMPLARLVYPKQALPGFTLPSANPADLRILHGSCRKPHGAGVDALAAVDKLLGDAIADPKAVRPQQLFLTGDQIYADDVHPSLLPALRAFASDAVGRDEEDTDLSTYAEQGLLEPGKRKTLCCDIAKLSTTEFSDHLITLAEFYAMYLFAWSPVPWLSSAAGDKASKDLAVFHRDLAEVRRALANISTYMVFDDHEVTDDWYFRESWCNDVLGNPLGRRVVRNALAAYAVFQHWGNVPDEDEPDRPLGRALRAINGWNGTEAAKGDLDKTLQIPERGADLVTSSPDQITWSWRWRGPTYEVIGLNTRTRRQFDQDHVSLLSEAEIDAVLRVDGAPPQFTLILSAAPVLGRAFIEFGQEYKAHIGKEAEFDVEQWSDGKTYKYLIKRLLDRAPTLILSGDVHYGFGASLVDKKKPETRIVNFVSTALKNMPTQKQIGQLNILGFFHDNKLQSGGVITPDGAHIRNWSGIVADCNVGEVRLYPDKNQVTQMLWYFDKGNRLQHKDQTDRFWLGGKP